MWLPISTVGGYGLRLVFQFYCVALACLGPVFQGDWINPSHDLGCIATAIIAAICLGAGVSSCFGACESAVCIAKSPGWRQRTLGGASLIWNLAMALFMVWAFLHYAKFAWVVGLETYGGLSV